MTGRLRVITINLLDHRIIAHSRAGPLETHALSIDTIIMRCRHMPSKLQASGLRIQESSDLQGVACNSAGRLFFLFR
jgi:hypothetical protein